MKVLVHRDARRRGIGRTLLVLDTRQGAPSEAMYGTWVSSQTSPKRRRHDAFLFYKEL